METKNYKKKHGQNNRTYNSQTCGSSLVFRSGKQMMCITCIIAPVGLCQLDFKSFNAILVDGKSHFNYLKLN